MTGRRCFMLTILLTVLFLAGLGTLVERPEGETAGNEPVQMAACPMLLISEAQSAEDGTVVREEKTSYGERHILSAAPSVVRAGPVSDRNGVPLRERSYVRSAWQVFVPERMPG